MRFKVLLAFTIVAFLTTGRAPGMRELRNPESEHGVRTVVMLKRSLL